MPSKMVGSFFGVLCDVLPKIDIGPSNYSIGGLRALKSSTKRTATGFGKVRSLDPKHQARLRLCYALEADDNEGGHWLRFCNRR